MQVRADEPGDEPPARAPASAAKPFLYAMDPTTTLYTFMLQTHYSVQSVCLYGSWDNFTMIYSMQRDSRRDHGQWRGCHTFQDILLCSDDSNAAAGRTTRSGGLKMGKTYYYYYELDGCTETHDPTMPSTSTCPYLPGQRVNMLWVPARGAAAASPASPASRRQRSASTSSLRPYEYQTMNPADRFVTPRQAPPTPADAIAAAACRDRSPVPAMEPRTSTTPAKLKKPAARTKTRNVLIRTSLSAVAIGVNTTTTTASPVRFPPPTFSTWSPRRLFVRRPSPARSISPGTTERSSRSVATDESSIPLRVPQQQQLAPPSSSSSTASSSSRPPLLLSLQTQGSRSRDISPESLRRFLVDDVPFPERSASRCTSRCASRCSSRADGRIEEAVPAAVEVVVPTQPPATPKAQQSTPSTEEDCAPEFCSCTDLQPLPSPKPPVRDSVDDELDGADDDELNFALLSATSESAPMTVLSPPPPLQLPQVASLPALSLDATTAGGDDGSLTERSGQDLCFAAVPTDARLQPSPAAQDSDTRAHLPASGMRGLVDELGWLATAIQRLD